MTLRLPQERHPAELDYRVIKVQALVATANDYLIPSTHDTLNGVPSGFSPGHTVPCSHPKANRVRGVCIACNGTGWRKRIASLDRVQITKSDGTNEWSEIHYDEYDTARRPLGGDQGGSRPATVQEIDKALALLERDADARSGDFGSEKFPWERAKEQRDRSGDYRYLEEALRVLQHRLPGPYGALRRIYMVGVHVTPTPHLMSLERQGLAWIAQRMPGAIKVPAWVEDTDTTGDRRLPQWVAALAVCRRDSIFALYDDGWIEGKISRRLGVPLAKVKMILRPSATSDRVAA